MGCSTSQAQLDWEPTDNKILNDVVDGIQNLMFHIDSNLQTQYYTQYVREGEDEMTPYMSQEEVSTYRWVWLKLNNILEKAVYHEDRTITV